jgi:hypothetical protein
MCGVGGGGGTPGGEGWPSMAAARDASVAVVARGGVAVLLAQAATVGPPPMVLRRGLPRHPTPAGAGARMSGSAACSRATDRADVDVVSSCIAAWDGREAAVSAVRNGPRERPTTGPRQKQQSRARCLGLLCSLETVAHCLVAVTPVRGRLGPHEWASCRHMPGHSQKARSGPWVEL